MAIGGVLAKKVAEDIDNLMLGEPETVSKTVVNRALIASNGGHGCVLLYCGEGIDRAISDEGTNIADLSLDDAPDGLSIWEGDTVYEKMGEGEDTWEINPQGAFRDLTPEEWKRLANRMTLFEDNPEEVSEDAP